MVDVACQTEATAPPPMPLPLQYPANLIYAQSMLAMCVSQLQQLDTNKALLHFYLWEHERRAAVASVLNSPILKPGGLNAPGSWMPEMTPPNAGEVAAAAGAAAGVAAGVAAGAAAGRGGAGGVTAEPQQQIEHLRVHRRRLAAAVKVALVMVLLEVRTGWFFVYFFAVFLYIGGLFDPFIQWFQRHSAQTTLDQQLAQLRNRQRRAAEDAEGHHQNVAAAIAGATHTDSHANDRTTSQRSNTTNDGGPGAPPSVGVGANANSNSNSAGNVGSDVRGNNNSSGSGSKIGGSQNASNTNTPSTQISGGVGSNTHSNSGAADGSTPVQSGGLSDDAEGSATNSQGSNPVAVAGESPQPAQGEEGPARPPWAHRFIYQLVVMFFMTLIPWWNPDPHYL